MSIKQGVSYTLLFTKRARSSFGYSNRMINIWCSERCWQRTLLSWMTSEITFLMHQQLCDNQLAQITKVHFIPPRNSPSRALMHAYIENGHCKFQWRDWLQEWDYLYFDSCSVLIFVLNSVGYWIVAKFDVPFWLVLSVEHDLEIVWHTAQ